jgi:AraC-like DNA-binding protein
MRHARALLRYTPMSVTEVALYLGYPRVHEFSREFRRRYGAAPSSARLAVDEP